MNVEYRSEGLQITYPSSFRLSGDDAPGDPTTRRRRQHRRGARRLPGTASDETDALIDALRSQEIDLVRTEVLEPTEDEAGPERRRGARRRSEEPQDVTLDLTIGEDEDAVLLVEQDGMYSWKLPDGVAAASPTERRRRGPSAAGKHVSFHIEVRAESAPRPPRARRGFVTDLVFKKIRIYVFKYVAKKATGALIAQLEAHVREGIVAMNEVDPQHWKRVDDLAELDLPLDRTARILLFIHGTFSSSLGAFGALGAYPWGRELLTAARRTYDAVVGFDHLTLSVDPAVNAETLLKHLRAVDWVHPPRIDVVTHSRGGLVFRSLVEIVLPKRDPSTAPRFDRVVFLGVPNSGTTLAEPENWNTLIDLYTNLAVAVFRVIGMVPQVKFAADLIRGVVQGLGALVKYLVSEAITKAEVPGLAAMQPGGPFISEINRIQVGQPGVDTTFYCAVTSEFEARMLNGDHEPKELSRRLLMSLADRLSDRLLDESSDLVVNTASMTALDAGHGIFIKDVLDFGRTPQVYHTNYFTRPEVVAALKRWLRLEDVAVPEPHRRRRSARGRSQSGRTSLPAAVETDFIVTTADATAGELREELQAEPPPHRPPYVVVRRRYEDTILHYAYAREEVEQCLEDKDDDMPLLDALDMHEHQASSEEELGGSARQDAYVTEAEPTTLRRVVLEGGRPVGVRPARTELPSAEGLAQRAVEFEASLRTADGGGGPPPSPPGPAPRRRKRGGSGPPRKMTRTSREEETGYEEAGPEPSDPEDSAPKTPSTIACHFYAEMNSDVVVGEETSLAVVVSQDVIEEVAGRLTASAATKVEVDRKIIIDIRPRRNFEIVGERRAEIDPPGPNAVVERFFDLRATDEGEGEVWVTARQGQVPLTTLRLKVRITLPHEAPECRGVAVVEADAEPIPMPSKPLCQLRIFDRDRGDEMAHEYELEIPGKVFDRFESMPIRTERQAFVDKLYREIEDRWLSSDEDEEEFREELRAMGSALFEQLFPDALQRVLWERHEEIDSIQVISTDPFIPWELVHLKEPGEALPDETLFLAQMGLVRWLHGSWFPERLVLRDGRARYVIPDYPHPDDVLPEAQEEIDFLERELGARAVEPKLKPIRQLLRGPGAFDLLHFACHGVAESDDISHAVLELEGRVENDYVTPEHLSVTTVEQHSRLTGADGEHPIVVINACQAGRLGLQLTKIGGFADAFLGAGAGAFVGTLWSVGDYPARAFTEALYSALLNGRTLSEAAVEAREAARKDGDGSWLAYAVYGHPHARLERK